MESISVDMLAVQQYEPKIPFTSRLNSSVSVAVDVASVVTAVQK